MGDSCPCDLFYKLLNESNDTIDDMNKYIIALVTLISILFVFDIGLIIHFITEYYIKRRKRRRLMEYNSGKTEDATELIGNEETRY